jgi:hypothetical protein
MLHPQASARLSLGRPLTIELPGGRSEQYEDLDEVVARFVDPLIDNVRVGGGCCWGVVLPVVVRIAACWFTGHNMTWSRAWLTPTSRHVMPAGPALLSQCLEAAAASRWSTHHRSSIHS